MLSVVLLVVFVVVRRAAGCSGAAVRRVRGPLVACRQDDPRHGERLAIVSSPWQRAVRATRVVVVALLSVLGVVLLLVVLLLSVVRVGKAQATIGPYSRVGYNRNLSPYGPTGTVRRRTLWVGLPRSGNFEAAPRVPRTRRRHLWCRRSC